jgi:SpoVK/Ycf46/Vps4 family AAA+-type ATPase
MPVDLSGALRTIIDRKLQEASRNMAKGDSEAAGQQYRVSAALMREYATQTPFPEVRRQREKTALIYEERASGLSSQPKDCMATVPELIDESPVDNAKALIHRSSITWEDIGGLEKTKEDIKTAYGIDLAQKPKGVKLKGWKTILLYGPPGTGKTLLAAATSNGLDATFFNVAISSVLSKYFGESSKLISALYAEARRSAPSIIYFDEIESLSMQRSGDEIGAERRVISTLLTELDGLVGKSDSKYVLTIAATNLPWLLDKAILSRFEKKIFVPLPDKDARESILRIHLERRGIDSNVGYGELGDLTEGYSGRELEHICREVVSRIVRDLNPQIPELVDKGFDAVQSYELKLRPVEKRDFEAVLAYSKPETTESDLKKFVDWGRVD